MCVCPQYMEQNEEDFVKYLKTFVTAVWGLLLKVSQRPGQVGQSVAASSDRFLHIIARAGTLPFLIAGLCSSLQSAEAGDCTRCSVSLIHTVCVDPCSQLCACDSVPHRTTSPWQLSASSPPSQRATITRCSLSQARCSKSVRALWCLT